MMPPFGAGFDPAQMMRLSIQTSMMMMEAQMVIYMRLMGMAGMWNSPPGEMTRMVTEKHAAAQSAMRAAGRKAVAGGSAGEVALAAVKPVRSRTRSNVARLTRKGPAA